MGVVICKGYKQGRGVVAYDVEIDGKAESMIPKDKIVKFIQEGVVSNAKIQWWQGKPIVRVQGTIALVKIDSENGTEQPTVKRTRSIVEPKEIKTTVVGKLSKKHKDETVYDAIIKSETSKQQKLKSTLDYSGMVTLEDLLDSMISDFGLKNSDKYKAMIAKKVKLGTKLSGLAKENLLNIQQSFASYIMNMCYNEIKDTYIKYVN